MRIFLAALLVAVGPWAMADPFPPGKMFMTGQQVIVCDELAQVQTIFKAAKDGNSLKAGVEVFSQFNQLSNARQEPVCDVSYAAGLIVSEQKVGRLVFGEVAGMRDEDHDVWAVEFRLTPSTPYTLWLYYPQGVGEGT